VIELQGELSEAGTTDKLVEPSKSSGRAWSIKPKAVHALERCTAFGNVLGVKNSDDYLPGGLIGVVDELAGGADAGGADGGADTGRLSTRGASMRGGGAAGGGDETRVGAS